MAAGQKRSCSGEAIGYWGSVRAAPELKSICFPETTPSLGEAKVFQFVKEDGETNHPFGETNPFGQEVPRGRIFKRECHEPLMSKVFESFERKPQVLLTGTPGVGTSLFGLLFLLELIRRIRAVRAYPDAEHAPWLKELGGRIVYEYKTGSRPDSSMNTLFYVIDTEKETVVQVDGPPFPFLERDTFLIRDGPCASKLFDGYIFWTSSPDTYYFQHFRTWDAQLLHMPAWTEAELIECWRSGCGYARLFSRLKQEATQDRPRSDVIAALEVLVDFCELELPVRHRLSKDEVAPEIHTHLAEVVDQPEYQEAVLRRWIADLGPVAGRVLDPVYGYNMRGCEFGPCKYVGLCEDKLKTAQRVFLVRNCFYPNDMTSANHVHDLLIIQATSDFYNFVFLPASPSLGRSILSTMLHDELKKAQALLGRAQGTNKRLVFAPLAHHVLRTSNAAFLAHSLTKPGETIEVQLGSLQECKVTDNEVCQPTFKIEEIQRLLPCGRCVDVALSVHHDREFAHRRSRTPHQVGQQTLPRAAQPIQGHQSLEADLCSAKV